MPDRAERQKSAIAHSYLISKGKFNKKSGQGRSLESIVWHCHTSGAMQMRGNATRCFVREAQLVFVHLSDFTISNHDRILSLGQKKAFTLLPCAGTL